MEELFNKIAKMNTSKKFGLLLLVVMLVLGGYYYVVYLGQLEDFDKKSNKLNKLNNTLIRKQAIAKNRATYQREIIKRNQELKEKLAKLPDKSQVHMLMQDLSGLAESTGLEILKFEPQEETIRELYAAIPIHMTVVGSYHEIAGFAYNVGKLQRIVNISNIKLNEKKEKANKIVVKADYISTAYRSLSTTELEAQKKKKKKK